MLALIGILAIVLMLSDGVCLSIAINRMGSPGRSLWYVLPGSGIIYLARTFRGGAKGKEKAMNKAIWTELRAAEKQRDAVPSWVTRIGQLESFVLGMGVSSLIWRHFVVGAVFVGLALTIAVVCVAEAERRKSQFERVRQRVSKQLDSEPSEDPGGHP